MNPKKPETFQTAKDEERLDYLLGFFDTHMKLRNAAFG